MTEKPDPFDILQEEIDKEINAAFSEKTIEYARRPLNFNRMNDPSGSAWIKGLCGDTMEIYLVIENDNIIDACFYTDGCGATLACGSVATEFSKGKTLGEVLSFSPRNIIDHLGGLPKEHIHCAILAANTLYKAIADYLLQY
ncbi:MAG: iron-sulfur cluster assembly scaffold protein [Spirochaetales bacterium]|nr:iron-sulfur cluster assembly scaffold protein [Spirochaetales bacterium]